MSGDEFGAVDFDLLADYVGGALDGSSDEAAVARLISDDAAWARAYAEMSAGVETVRAALTGWGSADEPMPLEIEDRIAAALSAADLLTYGTSLLDAPVTAPPRPSDRRERQLTAVTGLPGSDHDGRPTAAPARRRWPRWAAAVAIAAGVAAFAGFGINQLTGVTGTAFSKSDGGMARDTPGVAAASSSGHARALSEPSAERLLSTGTDYAPAALATMLVSTAQRTLGGAKAAPSVEGAPNLHRARVAAPLQPLTDGASLSSCLDAVTAAHSRGPVAVELVDYAAFQGSPALVILFADGSGERWAWVAGPGCGRSDVGADTRYSARVG